MTIIADKDKIDKKVPNHLAIIMDGNGRWAQHQGKPRVFGHKAGMDALQKIAIHAQHEGVKVLTVYAFSTENWTRPHKHQANQQSHERNEGCGDQHGDQKTKRKQAESKIKMYSSQPVWQVGQVFQLLAQRQSQNCRRVCAERHEANVTEREYARKAIGQIQTQHKDQEDTEIDNQPLPESQTCQL